MNWRRNKPLYIAFASVALTGAGLVALPAVGESVYNVEKGENHLKKHGYKNITGGKHLYVYAPRLCNKAFQRNYTATKDGQTKTVRVCYDPIFGTYRAPFQ